MTVFFLSLFDSSPLFLNNLCVASSGHFPSVLQGIVASSGLALCLILDGQFVYRAVADSGCMARYKWCGGGMVMVMAHVIISSSVGLSVIHWSWEFACAFAAFVYCRCSDIAWDVCDGNDSCRRVVATGSDAAP